MRLTATQIDSSLQIIQDIFRQLREQLQAASGKIEYRDKNDKGYVAPVTDLDVEVERIVMRRLAEQQPDVPVYGEESGYNEEQDGTFWLIDPIDGTSSFVKGIPGYTNMAVLIQDQEAVAGVIYNPHDNEMYVAQKGKGAFKNGERLDLARVPLPRVAFGRERLVAAINDMLKPAGVTCEPGPSGAGYGFGLVADGRLAARFNFPHQPGGGHSHDYAPGALLVREAGGVIVPVESDTYTYKTRSFVACHPEIEALVRRHARLLRELEIQTASAQTRSA